MLFYVYDENTSSTVPVEVSDIPELSEQELEFIYDDKVRKVWHSQEEEWYFSIIDVIDVLTDSSDPKQYVKKLRSRDPELSANWGTICTPVQMPAAAAMLQAWRGKRWKPKPASLSSPRRTPRASASSSPIL